MNLPTFSQHGETEDLLPGPAAEKMTDPTAEELPDPAAGELPELTDAPFNFTDIADAIDQLSICSGPGPDGISAILLKKSKITVSLMLYNIFHESLERSEIPDILKLGFICPILKPENKREKAASWRPVSLTSHIIKTLERVIRKRIVGYLEMNGLMDPDQHGSRNQRSCLSQLLEHYENPENDGKWR